METVIIVIHLLVVAALVALVLLQRSEGGALGIGGGGNFMTARATGNVLTRATGYMAAAFFATSIILTVIARVNAGGSLLFDTEGAAVAPGISTERTEGNLFDALGGLGDLGVDPALPAGDALAPVPNDAGAPVAPAADAGAPAALPAIPN